MVSLLLQKQHWSSPFHLFFNKLSLVKITPFKTSQLKILIFSGNLNFHKVLFKGRDIWFTRYLYIDFTEKAPCLERTQLMESFWLSNCTNAIFATSSFHLTRLSPTRALLKETLRGIWLITDETDICFRSSRRGIAAILLYTFTLRIWSYLWSSIWAPCLKN